MPNLRLQMLNLHNLRNLSHLHGRILQKPQHCLNPNFRQFSMYIMPNILQPVLERTNLQSMHSKP